MLVTRLQQIRRRRRQSHGHLDEGSSPAQNSLLDDADTRGHGAIECVRYVYSTYQNERQITEMAGVIASTISQGADADAVMEVSKEINKLLVAGEAGLLAKDNDVPKAYLNYIFFNKEMNGKATNFKQVTEAAHGSFEELEMEFITEEEGYLMAYTSNQTKENLNVFMDQMSLTHTTGPIVRVDDYYPFGLTFNTSEREGSLSNKFLYSGKEKQELTGWDDFGARMYMQEIGRWNAIDKMSDAYASFSPYNYVLNNPVINFDVEGKWTVSRHSEMTYRALTKVGFGLKQARLIAHYASYYADHPSLGVQIGNNAVHPLWQVYRFSGVDYSATNNSQTTSWHPVRDAGTFNNNIRHSMRSPEEREFGTISEAGAMHRGMKWGWDKVFNSAKEGHLKDFKKNDKGIQDFGVGLHALQDAYAHKGTDIDNHSVMNDIAGDLTGAKGITESAVTVHKLLSGDWEGLGNEIKISMDGMTSSQREQVINKINEYLKNNKIVEEAMNGN